MHTTHRHHSHRVALSVAGLACAAGWVIASAEQASATSISAPHVIDGAIAATIVEVRGGATCSGTPIAGTAYVVTAAHCVIDHNGKVGNRTVVRDGHEYESVAVLVDTRYHERPISQLDAAVLVMERPIPGPAATLGSALPSAGIVTLAGYQPVAADGSLLRPTNAGARVQRSVAEWSPTGCQRPATSLIVTDGQVRFGCGLVQGASGGGLFRAHDGELELIGILSAVSFDLTANFLVPLHQLRSLIDHPEIYRHLPEQVPARAAVAVS